MLAAFASGFWDSEPAKPSFASCCWFLGFFICWFVCLVVSSIEGMISFFVLFFEDVDELPQELHVRQPRSAH